MLTAAPLTPPDLELIVTRVVREAHAARAAVESAVTEVSISKPAINLIHSQCGLLRNALTLLILLTEEARDDAQREADVAKAMADDSLALAREAMLSEALHAGLPPEAAAAVSDLEEAPKSQACRAAWLALGTWAETTHAGPEDMVRYLLSALELPAAIAPRLISLLQHGSEAYSRLNQHNEQHRTSRAFIAASFAQLDVLLQMLAAPGGVATVAAGPAASYATCHTGRVLCWGRADLGQSGQDDPDLLDDAEDGALQCRVPRMASRLNECQIVQVSAAQHVLALGQFGELFAWGSASRGVLGVGKPSAIAQLPSNEEGEKFQPSPTRVASVAGVAFTSIAAAEGHSLAVTSDGLLFSWGDLSLGRTGLPVDGGGGGQQQPPFFKSAKGGVVQPIDGCIWEPALHSALQSVVHTRAVSSSHLHSLALSEEGRLYSWGHARYGKLGNGPTPGLPQQSGTGEPYQPEPRMVHALREWEVLACAAGHSHSIVICTSRAASSASTSTSSSSCWSKMAVASATAAMRGGAAASLAAGAGHGGTTTTTTTTTFSAGCVAAAAPVPPGVTTYVFAFGLATMGRLGLTNEALLAAPSASSGVHVDEVDDEPYMPFPTRLDDLDHKGITHIAAGHAHSLAVSAAGMCYGWGAASHGRLGVGSGRSSGGWPLDELTRQPYVPQPMPLRGLGGYRVSSIAAGETHSLACTYEGQLLVWGAASHGKLGFEEGVLRHERDEDYQGSDSEGGGGGGGGGGGAEPYEPMPRQLWVRA